MGRNDLLIRTFLNEKQLEKLNPPQDLRSAIEKIGWKNRPITA
ncbi:DNA-binding protein [Escherichia coli]|nr:DNA-binding protein [Escherichia coli]TZA95543.1 DNA-binding protein [Escherichia coli]